MKKGFVCSVVTGVLVLMGVGIASAGPIHDPLIQQREFRQERRIDHGVATGRLTPWEARALQREQAHIRNTEARMKADGHLTARERARLHHQQNVASRDIWRLKHNRY